MSRPEQVEPNTTAGFSSPISSAMRAGFESSSWIRLMFEEGRRLKKELGDDNVFDFTLGNPSAPPPARFKSALVAAAEESRSEDHRYMTNAGLDATRRFVAAQQSEIHGLPITENEVVMTTGAAGGLNVLFKSILDAGDEIILLRPYFPEYLSYVANHGGRVVVVDTDSSFQPVVERILSAVTSRTAAVLINSPNNPSGACYDQKQIDAIAAGLKLKRPAGRPILLVMDEPYRRLIYSGKTHPSVLRAGIHGIVATSFSKDLGLAGERIGFLCFHPEMPGKGEFFQALAIAIRILGFVNAPAFMQRVIPKCGDATVDLSDYRRNRDLLTETLHCSGYEFVEPEGAFFHFPKTPGGDDVTFCQWLSRHQVLCVPGRGFGMPGFMRISYAVPDKTVLRALPIFAAAAAAFGLSPRRNK